MATRAVLDVVINPASRDEMALQRA